MFDRKFYKKEAWQQSKGLSHKMILPLLFTTILVFLSFSIIYIPVIKQIYDCTQKFPFFQVNNPGSREEFFKALSTQTTLQQIIRYLLNVIILSNVNFLLFTVTTFIWKYRKTGEFSFEAFKKCFSLKLLKGALWFVFWNCIWFLPYTLFTFIALRDFNTNFDSNNNKLIFDIILIYGSFFYMIFAYVKILGYKMMPYILAEYPEISVIDALNLSKKISKGCRENIIVTQFSFIFWWLFSVLTLGFGLIIFLPYLENTFINMYVAIKNNAIEAKVISEEDFHVLQ